MQIHVKLNLTSSLGHTGNKTHLCCQVSCKPLMSVFFYFSASWQLPELFRSEN